MSFPRVSPDEYKRTEELLAKFSAFADKNLDPVAIDREAKIPDAVIKGLSDLGILGMTVPKEYGGLGFSQYAYCRVVQEIARRCGSTALFVNAHQSIGLKALLLFGTEEQKRRWLPPLARGQLIAAFALTEPNAGSDASGIETRAVYDPDKKVYRITGQKQWITNGSIANILTVMAKMEVETPQGKQDKITAFLVTPDMAGFKVTAKSLEKVGMRGTWTSNLAFENMEVPAANILGPIGGGLKVCLTVLDYGRTTFGAMCTGASKFLVEKAIDHAKNRYQFKRPLASFALVKQKIAEITALAYAIEAATFLTAGFVDGKCEDLMLESALLKVFASDSLWSILYDTMQIFGGRSFFSDAPFERMMRDARLNMIGEGSNEVLRAFIGVVGMRDVGMQLKEGKEALGNPFKNRAALGHLAAAAWRHLWTPKVPVRSPLFKEEARRLGRAVRRFGVAIVKLLAKHGEQILEKQLLLDRIATSAMAIYTATAVISKVDSDLETGATLGHDVEVAKLYCLMAFEQIDRALDTLSGNDDEKIENVSDLLSGAKHP